MGSTPVVPLEGVAEGRTLAGKYLLLRQLGAGGMCLVYEAEHIHLKQAVAVKLLKPELARDPDSVARFSREAQAAAKLRSANVARVHDVDHLPDGQPYITMELLVGHDLGSELQRRGALEMPVAVDYVRQACAGITEAHALGIIHRDLKPENLFLTELGALTTRKLVKILDFGIAKNLSETHRRLTAPDAVFGTVDYMSPEQIRSASTVDSRTDIWSLGVILYELLTGRLPYVGDARAVIAQIVSDPVAPPSVHNPSLPPALVAIVMKALSKDPMTRWQSADELRAALEPFADMEPITGVLARLPPQSFPRRAVGTGMRPLVTPAEESSLRDMRTNVTWVAAPSSRGVGKMWIAGAALLLLAAGAATAYVKRASIADHLATAAPPAPEAAAAPEAAPAPDPVPAPALAAETAATAEAVAALPTPAPSAPAQTPTVIASSTPPPGKGRSPRPRAPAARGAPASPPSPTTTTAPPSLPKHL